jgi:hypothetical protein
MFSSILYVMGIFNPAHQVSASTELKGCLPCLVHVVTSVGWIGGGQDRHPGVQARHDASLSDRNRLLLHNLTTKYS